MSLASVGVRRFFADSRTAYAGCSLLRMTKKRNSFSLAAEQGFASVFEVLAFVILSEVEGSCYYKGNNKYGLQSFKKLNPILKKYPICLHFCSSCMVEGKER